ncbi:tRNA(fMet)-specific endonuclease VapC [Thalassospira sp. GO-4]|jgi:tRNA(fMet)-specific endonuclease VapC|uniref:type II toxin-antitoxin system tRNA(fMet)-specific endonuclease VapC n=1 Tax=Thalassospira sp. GO-4 TaxID=2946605 RepID=UPI0020249CFD|nr:tRNA(fMet)-specific endonuclease VapC [Thalassospira sp. GO-4]URK18303.1 tRNA(fMet)-specific endonuclease VapC [Thalassospira sp. GO-4]
MLRFMLDTNICIYVIKNRPASCREKFRTHSGAMAISSVTLAELIYGAMKSAKPESNLRTIEEFAARLSVLDFDTDAAGHYGDIRSTLEREGNVIGPYDMMIAGHARSHGLILVTNNTREFERVDGLRLENWV